MARRADLGSAASARGLAALLTLTGSLHLLTPSPFDAIVPRALPGPARAWTYVSGAAELATAALLAAPATRRRGAQLAAALFVVVFPANVAMAVDWADRPPLQRCAALARLPLQVPLVLWARRVARSG